MVSFARMGACWVFCFLIYVLVLTKPVVDGFASLPARGKLYQALRPMTALPGSSSVLLTGMTGNDALSTSQGDLSRFGQWSQRIDVACRFSRPHTIKASDIALNLFAYTAKESFNRDVDLFRGLFWHHWWRWSERSWTRPLH
jgi:hypothetical protein